MHWAPLRSAGARRAPQPRMTKHPVSCVCTLTAAQLATPLSIASATILVSLSLVNAACFRLHSHSRAALAALAPSLARLPSQNCGLASYPTLELPRTLNGPTTLPAACTLHPRASLLLSHTLLAVRPEVSTSQPR